MEIAEPESSNSPKNYNFTLITERVSSKAMELMKFIKLKKNRANDASSILLYGYLLPLKCF